MSLDREALAAAVAAHGVVARIVVAGVAGSAPREPGAAMLVWAGGSEGTIGGGTLEWQAMAAARALRPGDPPRIDRLPLGPALGQCCGGAVTLVTEVWDASRLPAAPVRPLTGGEMPLPLHRLLARARAEGAELPTRILGGWIVEPLARPEREVWIWGAGHVGRAIVAVLAPLPGLAITWIDTGEDRFPEDGPPARRLSAAQPADLVPLAPPGAEHLILTYSHALDLELCHRLLSHGFRTCGLIGSESKWARFRSRLAALGHPPARIATIRCPIGDPALGKHPQAIAIGVAAEFLRPAARAADLPVAKDRTG